MTEPLFEQLTVIGLGLIGSSLARRARQQAGIAREVVAYDANAAVRARVAELGIAHRVAETEADAVRDADCVVLCVPVGAMGAAASGLLPHMKAGAILSDVGSTKQSVIREIQPLLPPGVAFVPAHPVAGTEYSGPDSGFPTLFEGRWALLTPVEGGDPEATARVARLWQLCGAMTREMDAAHHDRVLAIVSHLPHLLERESFPLQLCINTWRSPFALRSSLEMALPCRISLRRACPVEAFCAICLVDFAWQTKIDCKPELRGKTPAPVNQGQEQIPSKPLHISARPKGELEYS